MFFTIPTIFTHECNHSNSVTECKITIPDTLISYKKVHTIYDNIYSLSKAKLLIKRQINDFKNFSESFPTAIFKIAMFGVF